MWRRHSNRIPNTVPNIHLGSLRFFLFYFYISAVCGQCASRACHFVLSFLFGLVLHAYTQFCVQKLIAFFLFLLIGPSVICFHFLRLRLLLVWLPFFVFKPHQSRPNARFTLGYFIFTHYIWRVHNNNRNLFCAGFFFFF